MAALLALPMLANAGCPSDEKKPRPPKYATLQLKPVAPFLEGSIFQLSDLDGTEPADVSTYGLTVNLLGSGDTTAAQPIRDLMIKQMSRRGFGDPLRPGYERYAPAEVLRDPRVAIVQVDALIPPGARMGQRIDAYVSCLPGNNTRSLAHGFVYRSDLMLQGANPLKPASTLRVYAVAEGPIFVNPSYALKATGDSRSVPVSSSGGDGGGSSSNALSLRSGVLLNGAIMQVDRPMWLRVRQPSLATSRLIERRIQLSFQGDGKGIAAAKDEGLVELYVPDRYKGDWEHFTGVVTHLYVSTAPSFVVGKARELAALAQQPDAPLLDISYCWEALGKDALPSLLPLMTHSNPNIAYAATRAAAFLGDPSAVPVLLRMANDGSHPFQLTAIETLGKLPTSPEISSTLRSLLTNPRATVRIEAYEQLAEVNDPVIFSQGIDNNKFKLDIVSVDAPPLIYCTRTGTPRIAVIGNKPSLATPVMFSTMDNQLSISSMSDGGNISIFYRGPGAADHPKPILSHADVAELIARLGGEGGAREQGVNFAYGEIVAMLQAMADNKQLLAATAGARVPVSFVLQEAPRVQDLIDQAPSIPDQQAPLIGSSAAPAPAASTAAPGDASTALGNGR